jgi:hypothetical protein
MEIWSARRIVLVCWQGVNTRGAKLLIVSLVSLWKVSRVYIVMRNIARSRSLEKLKITSLNSHFSLWGPEYCILGQGKRVRTVD